MKKKIVLVLIAVLLCAGLIMGCGSDTPDDKKKDDEKPGGPSGPSGPVVVNPPDTNDPDFDPASIIPPTGFDLVALGNFSFANLDDSGLTTRQKGWSSNGFKGVATTFGVEDFLQAEYLWIWVENPVRGGMSLIWQGDCAGAEKNWNSNDIFSSMGVPAAALGVEVDDDYQDAYAIKIDLSTALKDRSVYETATAGVNLILAYYTPDLAALGNMVAYLLLPEGAIGARTYKIVTFDDPKGGGDIDDVSVLTGYPLGAKYPVPVLADNIFDYWKDASDAAFGKYKSVNDNAALTAVWVDAITVTFNYQDAGKVNKVITVGRGKTIATAQIPTIVAVHSVSGNAFGGWYLETGCTTSAATTLADGILASPSTETEIIFYAKWLPPVNITFDLAGGFGITTLSIDIPEGYTMDEAGVYPADPKKPGYTFDGWKDASDNDVDEDTAISAATALTAQWTVVADYVKVLTALDDADANNGLINAEGFVNATQTSVKWSDIFNAKYLVIETASAASGDGFGGLQISLQDSTSWAYVTTQYGDFISFAHTHDSTPPETVYFVIDLTALTGYDTFIKGKDGMIKLSAYPFANLGFVKATLTNKALTVSGGTDIKKGGDGDVYGQLTKTNPLE